MRLIFFTFPVTNLDKDILKNIDQIARGRTMIMIAHRLSTVRNCDFIVAMDKGRIVEVAPAEELFDFPLHPYTHSLISAVPIPDPLKNALRAKMMKSMLMNLAARNRE